MKKLESQNGSIAVIVTVTFIIILTALIGLHAYNSSLLRSQIRETMLLKDVYEKDFNSIQEIYDDLKSINQNANAIESLQ